MMDVLEFVASLLGHSVTALVAAIGCGASLWWPLVAVILALLFRDQIKERLSNVKELAWDRGPKVEFFRYGQTPFDERHEEFPIGAAVLARPPVVGHRARGGVRWNNTGNLFYAGHDLMWTIDLLLRGAPAGQIDKGLRGAHYHVASLAVTEDLVVGELAALRRSKEGMPDAFWTAERRNEVSSDLAMIIRSMGKLAKDHQEERGDTYGKPFEGF
jgi:hypothetical protein